MFEEILRKLQHDINVVRGVITIHKKLKEIIKDESSILKLPDLQDIKDNYPSAQDWLFHDHCSSITRLYALYENFVESLIIDWILSLPELYADNLPSSIKEKHQAGCATLLGNERKRSRFESLLEKDIIKNLHSVEFENRYNLTPAAFLLNDANLKQKTLVEILNDAGMCAFTDVWNWIEKHEAVANFILNRTVDIDMKIDAKKELDNFIEYRNTSAHGYPNSVLRDNELLKLCDFMEVLCEAIAEVVRFCIVTRYIEIGKIVQIGTVKNWFPNKEACTAKILACSSIINEKLKIQQKVYLYSDQKRICKQTFIEGIQVLRNGRYYPRKRVLLKDIINTEIGLKFDKQAKRYVKIYIET